MIVEAVGDFPVVEPSYQYHQAVQIPSHFYANQLQSKFFQRNQENTEEEEKTSQTSDLSSLPPLLLDEECSNSSTAHMTWLTRKSEEPEIRLKMGSLPKSFTTATNRSAEWENYLNAANRAPSDSLWIRKGSSLDSSSGTEHPFILENNDSINSNPWNKPVFFSPSSAQEINVNEEEKENYDGHWKSDKTERNNNNEPLVKNLEQQQHPSHTFFWNNFYSAGNDGCDDEEQHSNSKCAATFGPISRNVFSSSNNTKFSSYLSPSSSTQTQNESYSAFVVGKPSFSAPNSNCSSSSNSSSSSNEHFFSANNNNNNSGPITIPQQGQSSNVVTETTTSPSSYDTDNDLCGARRGDDVEALVTFLSKFDSKVAAIWGETTSTGIPSDRVSSSTGSTTNSPLQDKGNPWADHATNGSVAAALMASGNNNEDISMDLCGLHLVEATTNAVANEPLSGQMRSHPPRRQFGQHQVSHGKEGIMQSLERYFGPSLSLQQDDYHIIRRVEATSSDEELERSRREVNHSEEGSSFAPYIGSAVDVEFRMDRRVSRVVEAEMELWAACGKQKVPEVFPDEDLLRSWKTHFSTIEYLDSASEDELPTGPQVDEVGLAPEQINHNLPELRPFMEREEDYFIYRHGGRTTFPVRAKIRHQNQKATQTDESFLMENSIISCSNDINIMGHLEWAALQKAQMDSLSYLPEDGASLYGYDTSSTHSGGWMSNSGHMTFPYDDYGRHDMAHLEEQEMQPFPIDFEFMAPEYENSYGFNSSENLDYTAFTALHDYSAYSGAIQANSNRRRAKDKPCKYYFLEGMCRRGKDCRFSHQLVTCRYWAEGSCLKGSTCPFLHCFIEGREIVGHEDFEYGSNDADSRYQLESESDFPTLVSSRTESVEDDESSVGTNFPLPLDKKPEGEKKVLIFGNMFPPIQLEDRSSTTTTTSVLKSKNDNNSLMMVNNSSSASPSEKLVLPPGDRPIVISPIGNRVYRNPTTSSNVKMMTPTAADNSNVMMLLGQSSKGNNNIKKSTHHHHRNNGDNNGVIKSTTNNSSNSLPAPNNWISPKVHGKEKRKKKKKH